MTPRQLYPLEPCCTYRNTCLCTIQVNLCEDALYCIVMDWTVLYCSVLRLLVQTHVKRMVYLAEQYEKPRLRTKLIHDVLYAQSEEAAEKCLKQIPKEKVIGK